MRTLATVASAALILALTQSAGAVQIVPTSYDMPNGSGQANGGTYNYWDVNYSGSGSTATDGAALTGGSGKLTDGVVATDPWFSVSNNAGTGPYVGWLSSVTPSPTVNFNFSGPVNVSEIKIQLDNTGVGGVFAPSSILIDGNAAAFTAPTFGGVGVVDITGLKLTGSQHQIGFNYGGGPWVFVSEVQFFGGAVPEPSTWAMMVLGFAGLVFMGHKARARRVAA